MRLLVIHGSLRKGNTYKLTEAVIAKMQELGKVQTDEIFAAQLQLPFCTSCHNCVVINEAVCSHSAIVSDIQRRLVECDAIIITTPVYSMQLSAALKNVIDHLSYMFHRPSLLNKKALIIVTTAGGGEKATAKYIKNVLEFWAVNKIYTLALKVLDVKVNFTDKLNSKIAKTARLFYNDIVSNKLHSPNLKEILFFNAFKALSAIDKDKTSPDYKFFKKMGWLNTDYYTEANLGIFKRIISRILFGLFKILFKKG